MGRSFAGAKHGKCNAHTIGVAIRFEQPKAQRQTGSHWSAFVLSAPIE